jgi:hypothetical protein
MQFGRRWTASPPGGLGAQSACGDWGVLFGFPVTPSGLPRGSRASLKQNRSVMRALFGALLATKPLRTRHMQSILTSRFLPVACRRGLPLPVEAGETRLAAQAAATGPDLRKRPRQQASPPIPKPFGR